MNLGILTYFTREEHHFKLKAFPCIRETILFAATGISETNAALENQNVGLLQTQEEYGNVARERFICRSTR